MDLLDFINGNNYGVFNRQIARAIGLNTSIVLSELIDKFQYYSSKKALTSLKNQEGLWFYLTAECIQERTTLTEKEQRSCIDKLMELGFIKKTLSGLPAKRYFQLDTLKIFEFFSDKINSTILAPRPDLISPEGVTCHSLKPAMDPYKKNLNIKTKEEKKSAPPPTSAEASDLCKIFIEKIKERHGGFRPPDNPDKWEKEFAAMIDHDKRHPVDILALIRWIRTSSFWKPIILSPSSLRKHYDTVTMQMQSAMEEELSENNRRFAINLKNKYPDRLKNLTINKKYAMNLNAGKEIPFDLPEETFRNALCNMFGGKYEPNGPISGSNVGDSEEGGSR